MLKTIKECFSGIKKLRKSKMQKTRNIILCTSIMVVLIIAAVNIAALIISTLSHTDNVYQMDSDIVHDIISFFKWCVTTGCAITIAKTVKGKTNSDNEESDKGE